MPLITATQFIAEYRLQTTEGLQPSYDVLISRADALMANFCGWPANTSGLFTLVASTYELYPEPLPSNPRALQLGVPWVASSPAPVAYIAEDWNYASYPVTAADLVLDSVAGILWLTPSATSFGQWSDTDRANKVTLTAGFATTPPDLVAAALVQTRYLLGLPSVRTVDGTGALDADETEKLLAPGVERALAPYINWGSRAG